jgi:hypothetical protein
LSLEQVDKMMEETSPRTSSKWRPRATYASTVVTTEGGKLEADRLADVERKGSVF